MTSTWERGDSRSTRSSGNAIARRRPRPNCCARSTKSSPPARARNRFPIRPDISRGSLEALLDAEAFESAALRLVSNCGYMLSRGGDGLFIASVVIPAAGRDYSFSGPSAELALCGALAVSLQECLAVE